jgi:hypothetical protein
MARHETTLCDEILDLATLRAWMASHSEELDANPAAWCAVEIAILDLLAQERGQTIEAFLSLPPLDGCFRYTAVLGDSETKQFERTVEQYRRLGFTDFKIKLSGDLDRKKTKMAVLRAGDLAVAYGEGQVDANNLWSGPRTRSVSPEPLSIASLPSRSRFARISMARWPPSRTHWIVRSFWTRASDRSVRASRRDAGALVDQSARVEDGWAPALPAGCRKARTAGIGLLSARRSVKRAC